MYFEKCFGFISVAVINTRAKNNLGKERVHFITFSQVTHCPTRREVRTGTRRERWQGLHTFSTRELTAEDTQPKPGRNSACLLVCWQAYLRLASFLGRPQTTCPETVPLTVAWTLQLITVTIPTDVPHRPIWAIPQSGLSDGSVKLAC